MKIGQRLFYRDFDTGQETAGTVFKLRTEDAGVYVRLDTGERVLAFPEDVRPIDALHPSNVDTVRCEIESLESKGRFSEATLLREAYPEAAPAPRKEPAPAAPVIDHVEPAEERPAAGVFRTSLDPVPGAPSGDGAAPGAAAPDAVPQPADDNLCPKCGKRDPITQDAVRGGVNVHRCLERIGPSPKPGQKDTRPICGGTWVGGEADIPAIPDHYVGGEVEVSGLYGDRRNEN